MILQALHDYYERKNADPESGLAQPGFEWKEIPFVIEIDTQGKPVQIEDTREGEGKKKRARAFLVPQGVKRAVRYCGKSALGQRSLRLGGGYEGEAQAC